MRRARSARPGLDAPRRKTPMIRLTIAAALLAAAAALPALAQNAAKPPAGAKADDAVVAKIDSQAVRRSDIELARLALPAEFRQMPLETIYSQLLEKVIERKLAAFAAKKGKLDEGDVYKRQFAFISESVLEQVYFNAAIDAQLTEDKLRQRFARAMANFKGDEEVAARHILVETENDAKAVVKSLEGGADFGKLAREKSIDPSARQNGGDLGYFARGQMVPEFSEAAFALKVGQISKPVKSSFGWHVVVVDGRRQSPPPSYEQAIDDLRQDMAREVVAETLEKLRSAAKIERFGLDGKPMEGPARR